MIIIKMGSEGYMCTCIFSFSKLHLYLTKWTGNVHSLVYGTNPVSPQNPQKNCQTDVLKKLVERVYGQVVQKSSRLKLCHPKSQLCHPIGLVKLP